jgi:1,4-alpha-glucan branching enzyme
MKKATMAKNAKPSAGGRKKQTFAITAPTAMSVQLVGDFTHWQDQPINMQKGTDGVWRATALLSPGTHHYRFLVDGLWRDDPECTLRVSNPYGGQDSVRQVA